MIEIVYPFLEKIGVLWLTNNITPAQEHFISLLIRQKIIVAIDALPLAPKTAKKAVLFLPENELHEIGLLFYYYIAKKLNIRTYYLGQTVPYSSLKSIFEEHKPEILISSLTTGPKPNELQSYLDKLSIDFKAATIILSGYVLTKSSVNPPKNIRFFTNALDFRDLINSHFV